MREIVENPSSVETQNHTRFLNPLLTIVASSCYQFVLIDWFNNRLIKYYLK